jgi:hypothetical protein
MTRDNLEPEKRVAMGWRFRGSNLGRGMKFFLLQNIQNGSGAPPVYLMGTGFLSRGV